MRRRRRTPQTPPRQLSTPEQADKRYGQVYDARILRRLWPYMAPYAGGLTCATICMIGVTLSHLAAPYMIKLALDTFIARGDRAGLTLMVLFYVANAGVGWIMQYGQTVLMARAAQRVLRDLRQALFRHLMRLDLAFYDRQSVGRLMSRVQNDVGTLQDLFTSGILQSIGDLLSLVGIVAVMVSMHGKLTLITFTVVPLVILLTTYWRVLSRQAFQRVRVALARVNASLQENISGVRVIQSLVSEDHNLRRFEGVNQGHLEANLYAAQLSARILPMIEVLSVCAIALVVACGGPLVLAGSLSAGALVAFVLYMYRFFDPIRDISFRWNHLQMAMAAGERIFAVLDTGVQIREAPQPVVISRLRGDVEFRHVGFHYRSGPPVLQNLSLHVPAGQHLAIVGHTGAGKTTLINLIARLYDVTDGAILLDGIDVRQLSVAHLRRQIGMVLQEPFLFSGTVRENMRYGNATIGDEDIVAAAKAMGVHDAIMRLAQGYDTDVHERGGLLSHGQRQLISFVRALLADPRLLILDEATASIDTETERLVQAGLETLLHGRTAFIIAHRLSTVKHADRIIVLDHGRVVESGTHDTLVQQEGLYHRLYAMTYAGLDVGL